MGLTLNKKQAEAPVVEETNVASAAVEAPVEAPAAEEVYDETIGSLSDKIAFVAPLGNPLRDDVTKVVVDGKETQKRTPFIVGYRMKALVDLVVPDCGTTDKFKKDYMDFNDINGKKAVKAGETFDLTPFEMAVLAADKRVNKKFTGGDRIAQCCWAKKELQGGKADGVTVKSMPRAMLRLAEGSIKDYNIIHVLEASTELDETGKQKKVGTINPGFEKWAPLCKATVRTAGGRSAAATKSGKPVYDASASSFMAILKSKGYQAEA
jgi:hypothetical protein